MTDVDAMTTGAEMDALVAERVMGWRPPKCHLADGDWTALYKQNGDRHRSMTFVCYRNDKTGETATSEEITLHSEWEDPRGWPHKKPAPFSTSIDRALEIVENLRARGLSIHIYSSILPDRFHASISQDPGTHFHADGLTMCLTVCRVALKAVAEVGKRHEAAP